MVNSAFEELEGTPSKITLGISGSESLPVKDRVMAAI
jgi:hypothetical protein